MKINEKISILRKQNGYSQEELAAKLGVSRQSVSKWELGESVPDLERVIRLAELFSLSTDQLLREDQDFAAKSESAFLSDEKAERFIKARRKSAPLIAAGVLLCILSPVLLIVLGAGYEAGYFHTLFSSEDAAGTAGLIVLLFLAAVAVGLFIYSGLMTDPYEWMETEPVQISNAEYKKAKKELDENRRPYTLLLAAAICLIILGIIPMLALSLISEALAGFGVGIMLTIIAFAAAVIVYATINHETWQILLEEGDYTPAKKKVRRKYRWLPGTYWCVVTAIYLVISFLYDSWEISWVIYMAAGILYGALVIFLQRNAEGRH